MVTGERFTAIDRSDFNLFPRFYFEGAKAIEPVLEQRQTAGYNMARVWLDINLEPAGIGKLLMKEHLDAYDRIPDFCSLLARYGSYPHFTAFAGDGSGTDRAWRQEHWRRLGEVVPKWALVSLCNEWNAHAGNREGIELDAFQPIPGVLCSHGSNGADSDTVRPIWGFGEYHSNGLSEWWRKVGHNAMELSKGPMMATENTRFPDADHNPMHAFDAAAGAALLTAGSCYHSVHGKNSQLWEGTELICAQAWADGARSVDLACQDGRYVHAKDLESETIIRAYQRVLGDGRAFTVKIHV